MSFITSQQDPHHIIQSATTALGLSEPTITESATSSGRTYTILDSKNVKVLSKNELLNLTDTKISQLEKILSDPTARQSKEEEHKTKIGELRAFRALVNVSDTVDSRFIAGLKKVGQAVAPFFASIGKVGQMIETRLAKSRDNKYIKAGKCVEAVDAHRELLKRISGKDHGSFVAHYKDVLKELEDYSNYKQIKEDLDYLLTHKNGCWKIVSNNRFFITELTKEDVHNIKFLAANGLFSKVSGQVLTKILMSSMEEKDREAILSSLFNNAKRPKDRERIIRTLMATSGRAEQSSFSRYMLKAPKGDQVAVPSRAELAVKLIQESQETIEPREICCLAALTGDKELIDTTLPPGVRAELDNFLTQNAKLNKLSQATKDLLLNEGDPHKKIYLHYLMEGARYATTPLPGGTSSSKEANMVDLCTSVFFATKMANPNIGNPFLYRDSRGFMPANSLHIGLGNLLDDKFNQLATAGVINRRIDGNSKGSLSNLAAYLDEQAREPSLAMMFFCGMAGKLIGEIASSHIMVISYGQHFLGFADMLHSAELNAPVYGGFALGAMFAIPLQHLVNSIRAKNAGLELSLSQYDDCNKPTDKKPLNIGNITSLQDPYFAGRYSGSDQANINKAIKKRDAVAIGVLLNNRTLQNANLSASQLKELGKIHYFPSGYRYENEKSVDFRQEIYQLIIDKATTAKTIERLINSQLMHGEPGVAAVKKLIGNQIKILEKGAGTKEMLESPRYRACLEAAVQIGDVDLINTLAQLKGGFDKPIFVPMQNHKGDTLLHLACLSQNADAFRTVVSLMAEEFKDGPITYEVKRSKQQVLSMPSVKEFNISFSGMLAKAGGVKTVRNPFEIQNGSGLTIIESNHLSYSFANVLDEEVFKIDAANPNSISFKKRLSEDEKFKKSFMEFAFLIPLKMGMGVPISTLVSQIVGYAIGAATAPFGGVAAAPTIAGIVAFAMAATVGTMVFVTMLVLCAGLLAMGTKTAQTVENWLKGFESKFDTMGQPEVIAENLKILKEADPAKLKTQSETLSKNYQDSVINSLQEIGVLKEGNPDFEFKGKNIGHEINKIFEDETLDPTRAYLRVEKLINDLDIDKNQRVKYTFKFVDSFSATNRPANQPTETTAAVTKRGEIVDTEEKRMTFGTFLLNA